MEGVLQYPQTNVMTNENLLILSLCFGIFSFLAVIFLYIRLSSLKNLRKKFFAGQNGSDLEDVIKKTQAEILDLKEEHERLKHFLKQLNEDISFTIQKIGVVRFSTFDGQGGDFSFSIALLDGHDSGVLITSMHGRQQSRTYTKKITNAKSASRLTEEEEQAIREAMSNFKK
jgi:hypothetical protein